MDRLQEMRVFVAVADAGSFVGAARKLVISPPAVTRAVAALEARLAVQLFQRTTRAVRLTEPGARFVETARHLLLELDTAEKELVGEAGDVAGILMISASVTFGRYVLAPIVAEFLAAHPQIRISMVLSERLVELVDEGIDLAVRIAELPDSSLIARRVGTVQRMLVASPDYLAAHGVPETPAALSDHAVIAFTGLLQNREWRYRTRQGARRLAVEPRLEVNDAATAIMAAEAGQGITGVYSYMVSDAVQEGRLVPVLADHALQPVPVQLVYPEGRFVAPKLRAFMDFAAPRLSEILEDQPAAKT
ncbi:MAG: LysR family transcriptional regulator [Alphaproteobacteria bacterium]|jgi:DNA-binding transcriptional LysR family regulator|nr:LysR family transcriptional regulator [Alphaproteobacteria bacterium]